MLEKELETYEKNRESLILRSENRYALIHGEQILEIFDSHMDAISHGYLVLGNVPFLVKRVVRNDRPAESFTGAEEEPHADL